MAAQICPFLITLDADRRRAAAVEFPSFENHCMAAGTPELIVLGVQATYCLSAACTHCARFQSAQQGQEADAPFVPFVGVAEDIWQQPSAVGAAGLGIGTLQASGGDAESSGRARWRKVGAGLIFLSVLLCGSLTAAYSGWEWATRDLRAETAAGRVDVAAALTAAPPAVYVVMTATPIQVAIGEPVTNPGTNPGTDANVIPLLPQAVTPTPIRLDPGAVAAAPTAADGSSTAGEGQAADESSSEVDVDLLVPTRRPTPVFDVPTSTPLAEEAPSILPTETPSLTPAPLGTPIIIFAPAQKELMKGECTMVRWNVQNVREVYYENLPMNGQGEREECINDKGKVYTLMVVLSDGQTQIITTSVEYLPPTPTPTPTPSFTPEPVFTPTWTPEPPTPTAPPNLFYATNLAVNGSSNINCAAGQPCEVGLLVTNGGSGSDNITLLVLESTGFSVELCRPDGVCGASSVPIINIGASNTAFVTARFSLPADAPSQSSGAASFQARSDGSGGGVTSSAVSVTVVVP